MDVRDTIVFRPDMASFVLTFTGEIAASQSGRTKGQLTHKRLS